MSLLRRRAMYRDGEFPDMYQKLAFLQSDGKQYLSIDDYIPQIGDSLSTNFVRMYNNWGVIFSAGTGKFQFITMTTGTLDIGINTYCSGVEMLSFVSLIIKKANEYLPKELIEKAVKLGFKDEKELEKKAKEVKTLNKELDKMLSKVKDILEK